MMTLSWLIISVVGTVAGFILGFLIGVIYEGDFAEEDEDE